MVDDVFQHVSGHSGMVEDPADNNGVVRRVVVAQDAACLVLAPAHAGTRHQPMKEASVEVFKDGFEVVKVSLGGAQKFAASHLADEMGFTDDFMAADVFAIARSVRVIDGAAVHLGQEDMCDRLENGLRSTFEEVGQPDEKASVAKTDGVVDVREGKKLDFQLRWAGAGAELCVGFLEKFEKSGTHGEGRVARERRASDLRLRTSDVRPWR